MKYLSQFDLLQIRTRLQAASRQPFDVLNPAGLHAALAAPRQAVFGEELYSGLVTKAAILFTRLISNHPFYDGNKRIAVEALRLFLARNNSRLAAGDTELLQWAHQVATRDELDLRAIEAWIEQRLAR